MGNNDFPHKYSNPLDTEKEPYYSELYNIWFRDVPGNSKYPNLAEIKESFLDGGYYRYDLSDTLSVLSINSISVNSENENDLDVNENMLFWLG